MIVGKFSPLHLGHDHLIRTAMAQTEELVLVSYSNPEFPGYEPERRERWLRQNYSQARVIVLSENLPLNSDHEDLHRQFVGEVYHRVINEPLDAVFTSESYGDGFAKHLTGMFLSCGLQSHPVEHVSVDPNRKTFSVSGTEIRKNIHGNRQYLVPGVYSDFVESACFIGAESTGKSTMSSMMAEILATTYADEYGRTLWEEQGGKLSFPDFLKIARTQMEKENQAREKANRIFFADTSLLTTLFYSYEYYGKADPELERLSHRPYNYLFLCAPDFPLVQDGTRQDQGFRLRQHEWYVDTLQKRGTPFQLLTGDLESRKRQVLETLSIS